MTMWSYKDRPFTDDMVNGAYGFVYRITNTVTGKQYYGKKVLHQGKDPPSQNSQQKTQSIL